MELLAKIAKDSQSLAIFANSSILDGFWMCLCFFSSEESFFKIALSFTAQRSSEKIESFNATLLRN